MATGLKRGLLVVLLVLLSAAPLWASEADLKIPELTAAQNHWLYAGFVVCFIGMVFGYVLYSRVRDLPAHKSMLDVAGIIFETCKTYLWQQGKLLFILELFIGACIVGYYGFLQHMGAGSVLLILLWSVIGILGSYGVAWFGIRMNTLANARMAFAALRKQPVKLLNIPLQAGMSIGVLLICVELTVMLFILCFMPRNLAGMCFIGFAIGESLGASALRICGGIFTKIADIGSDLMKVVFKIKEDDPRNPGVIADCTGDNAGDSVGPTADGFETYGVTGVALISFIVLAVTKGEHAIENQTVLLTWIFVMRALMVLVSIGSYLFNNVLTNMKYAGADDIDFEAPLNKLVKVTSFLSIIVTFVVSYVMLKQYDNHLWIWLSVIISCGTLAGWLIPEFTQIFTSTKSKHVREVVTASKEGGASLTVLSGLVAGNFSAFWQGIVIAGLMF
ncbi:MAG TPA: sodium/proton-translocating pyrophosphatase, partial [bacterium]|nr:sodium/proton-translocating pyrophosphatase [bacterium]